MIIKEVTGKIALDSRNEKTIQVLVRTKEGVFSGFSPSGKSKGKYEVQSFLNKIEDDIKSLQNTRLENIEIKEFKDLEIIEKELQGKVGGNTIFALESALLKALAAEKNIEVWQLINPKARRMPMPVGNCIGGGLHTQFFNGKKPDFQEFLIIPKMTNFSDASFVMKKVHEEIGKRLKEMNACGELNDENAWSTSLSNEECLKILDEVRRMIESEVGGDIEIGVDVASSSFYNGKNYVYRNPEASLSNKEQISYVSELVENENIFYVEDVLHEEAFEYFKLFREKNKGKCLVVGDDLTVTNVKRFIEAIKNKSINAIIVKPNQIGSLIEVKKIIEIAKKLDIVTIMSHRSGETLDYILADLAFGFQTEFIKTGILGKEREAKLKRLIQIEKSIK